MPSTANAAEEARKSLHPGFGSRTPFIETPRKSFSVRFVVFCSGSWATGNSSAARLLRSSSTSAPYDRRIYQRAVGRSNSVAKGATGIGFSPPAHDRAFSSR